MTMATMGRRELLKTACFASGVVLPGESAARAATQSETTPDSSRVSHPSPDSTARWFLDWLPPSLAGGDAGYSIGATPAGRKGDFTNDHTAHLITDQAMLRVSLGTDPDKRREMVREGGYQRLSNGDGETYGRAVGGRYRVVSLNEDATIRGVGPAAELVRDRVCALADTHGTDEPGDRLALVFDHVLPADHVSVDVRPTPDIAVVGECIIAESERSRLRTVVLPTPEAEDQLAERYLKPTDGIDGVTSTSTAHHDRVVAREATIHTTSLRDRLEGNRGI
jgi:hypothetical protein